MERWFGWVAETGWEFNPSSIWQVFIDTYDVRPSPSWAFVMEHQLNRLNPLTLATSILVRIAILTAYFIFLVSQLKKYIDVFVGVGK